MIPITNTIIVTATSMVSTSDTVTTLILSTTPTSGMCSLLWLLV